MRMTIKLYYRSEIHKKSSFPKDLFGFVNLIFDLYQLQHYQRFAVALLDDQKEIHSFINDELKYQKIVNYYQKQENKRKICIRLVPEEDLKPYYNAFVFGNDYSIPSFQESIISQIDQDVSSQFCRSLFRPDKSLPNPQPQIQK